VKCTLYLFLSGRLACLDCRCRGCNNPNLPGGGKLLPFADLALSARSAAAATSARLSQADPSAGIAK
jgi:hypothetical protein